MDLKQILQLLDGKKVKILAIITTTTSFFVSMGYIGAEVGTFISTITGIILGSAAHVTPKMLGKRL